MGFELICLGLIALLSGFLLAFFGYRLFVILLPIWGFVFGFALAVQTIELIFGSGYLSTVTAWVVGVIVGVVAGLLSYLFWLVGVALFSASFGYVLGSSLLAGLGVDEPWLIWLAGLAIAGLLALVVIRWNWQKYAIILITSLTGAALIAGGLLLPFGFYSIDNFVNGLPVKSLISSYPLVLVFWVLLASMAVITQWRVNRNYELPLSP
jgi:hypothetical protein